jgi:hypothetical protein
MYILTKYKHVRFEVLTAVVMKSSVLWDISPHNALKVHQRFWEHVTSIFRIEE